ncbi:CheR family methyltransferase, partial [Thermodesulfobacteriota bacterium]
MDDQEFRQLLEYLQLSWKGYRKVRKGVKKRIRRHMKQLEMRDMGGYLRELENSTDARAECDRLMTVSISRFFRDRGFWSMLKDKILPDLIREHTDIINVWSAGCACGEEVYSLKIVWDRLKSQYPRLPAIKIMATDLNPVHLDRAKSGIYTSSSLKELPGELRSAYFDITSDKTLFSVKP